MAGKLYLIPTPLGEVEHLESQLPAGYMVFIPELDGFIAEKAKSARAFLKHFKLPKAMQEYNIVEWSQKRERVGTDILLEPILRGEDWGVVSEAGSPTIADPAGPIVRAAHEKGIQVVPLIGPSSIFLALMASGLSGQNFVFHGYLSKEPGQRKKELRTFEKNSQKFRRTQIFMETPYRNPHLLRDMMEALRSDTDVCIATDVTLPTESIQTKTVAQWQKGQLPDIHKRPTIFLMQAR